MTLKSDRPSQQEKIYIGLFKPMFTHVVRYKNSTTLSKEYILEDQRKLGDIPSN